MKRLFILLICAALISAPSCAQTPPSDTGSSAEQGNTDFGALEKYSVSYTDFFDTVTDFTAYCRSKDEFDRVSGELYAELLRLHRLFDIYNEYNGIINLAYLNRVCGETEQRADPDIIALLECGRKIYGETDGRMNTFSGSLLSVWHKYRETGGVPSYGELSEAAEHISADSVVINGDTVRFTDKDLKLDVGATAKGYASHSAAEKVKNAGVENFILNIGGNVVVSGKKPEGPWKVGVQNPLGEGIFTKLKVSDISVVTSGDYERYYEYEGKKYHHIIDMRTLYPAVYFSSVTVIHKDPTTADALSTALFCMELDGGKKLAEKYGAEVLWIRSDGSSEKTAGFSAYE